MDAEDPVLVVLVSRPSDLEIVRREHWYRIPAEHSPRHLAQARYLAFYLTSAFGADRWSVREYAPVRGHELVRRVDLFPDESGHKRANDPYLKVQLGSLLPVPHPITSRNGRRILFIWTTGSRFSAAVELNDLLSVGQADDVLWAELKSARVPAERHVAVREGRLRYRFDYWIACSLGNVGITIGKTRRVPPTSTIHSLGFPEEQVIRHPRVCARQIAKLVCELGTPKYTSELSL